MMRIQALLSQFIAKMGGELMLFQCGRIVPKRAGYEGNLGGVHKSIILKGVGNAISDQHHANRIHPLSDIWCSVYRYYFLFTLDGCLLFSLNMSVGIISIL
ncbi:putative sucrose-phosphate synthase [Helianthus anomalus]